MQTPSSCLPSRALTHTPLNQANVSAAYHLKVGSLLDHPPDYESDELLDLEMGSLSFLFCSVLLSQPCVNGNEESASLKLGELIGAIERESRQLSSFFSI